MAKFEAFRKEKKDVKFRILPTVIMEHPQTRRRVQVNAQDQMLMIAKGYAVVVEKNMGASDATPGTVPPVQPPRQEKIVVQTPPTPKGE